MPGWYGFVTCIYAAAEVRLAHRQLPERLLSIKGYVCHRVEFVGAI